MPDNNRKFIEEKEIEKELIDYGWTIVFPEKITLANQLTLYENAKFIAGTEGSAFHVLMGISVPQFRIIVLSRTNANPNLKIQFSSLKSRVEFIHCLESTKAKTSLYKNVALSKEYTSSGISKIVNNHTIT